MSDSTQPNTNDKLVDLFNKTLDAVVSRVRSEDVTAADLRVAMEFLKNQGISSNTQASPKLNLLADSVPFPIEEARSA
jgi:hypothetical protein